MLNWHAISKYHIVKQGLKAKFMSKRTHLMPFGTQILPDGRVRFRLWAPGAKSVELCLQGKTSQTCVPVPLASESSEEGWYEIDSEQPARGAYYHYRINGETDVPDPASRFQPRDIEDVSQVIDPLHWEWQDEHWRGRPWEETVIYELHTGTFTTQGNYTAIKDRLDYLLELGVTAIELMPIADFPGRRNWGYDGVLLFAPDSAYGTPEQLKDLVQTAHNKGLMVFLDVVYNHFGPKGNYLHLYAPRFFTDRHHTPWGSAINFDGPHSPTVREFFIHNALYWLEEYHLDGLRFDAVHAICDDSRPDILQELAERVHNGPGLDRHIHLMLENDNNAAHYLRPRKEGTPHFAAQWNDDIHHILHILLTGETGGYYQDYADNTIQHFARCLTEGFAYQGEVSAYRDGRYRGEPSGDLPPTAFVSFLQNHDQVGNRALGERVGDLCTDEALRAATAVLLLAPAVPMLFMGQEWNSRQPFPYFVDFDEELGGNVTQGRLKEFAKFPEFHISASRSKIPPPNEEVTFLKAKLQWRDLDEAVHHQWLELHRFLLSIRHQTIEPRLANMGSGQAHYEVAGARALTVTWTLADQSALKLIANLGDHAQACDWLASGELLYTTHGDFHQQLNRKLLRPWSMAWFLVPPRDETFL